MIGLDHRVWLRRRARHRECSAHQVIRRELSREHTSVQFIHAPCQSAQRQSGRRVHDGHQHAVVRNGSNETEVDRAMQGQLVSRIRRVQELELTQRPYRREGDDHLVTDWLTVARDTTERLKFREDPPVHLDRDEPVRGALTRDGHVLTHAALAAAQG